jgi:hypothetical protein
VGESFIDWADLSGLDRVVAVYGIGDNVLVVETSDGREVRITARRDLRTGRFNADFERRGTVRSGGQEFSVWAHTSAYGHCEGDGLQACLEEAVLQVDRLHLY